MSTFLDYLVDISGGATQAEIAKAADVDQSSVSRWRRGSSPNPEAVAKLASHYGRPFPEMLYRAGLISEDTAKQLRISGGPTLSSYHHATLLRELQNRLEAQSSDPSGNLPTEEEEDPHPDDYDLAAGHVARPDHRPAD